MIYYDFSVWLEMKISPKRAWSFFLGGGGATDMNMFTWFGEPQWDSSLKLKFQLLN